MPETIIEARGLCKRYRTRVKAEGLAASAKALFHAQYREVEAVNDLSFTVERGETIAFIGPNGAGKSTTIKMLTGILTPTLGSARVLGMDPTRQRQQLAYRIGTVFGQKSQLWFHLPPADSFALLGAIYDLDKKTAAHRAAELAERFDITDLLSVPVRKLSLGQRIRCEIVASLLHEPEVIFFDEPTIGLDVVVKHAIREFIHALNRERQVTVFLTSHDPGDVEQLCRRAMVINHGRLVLDQSVKSLKYDYFNRKDISVRFFEPTELPVIPGVTLEKDTPLAKRLSVDTRQSPIGEVMRIVSALGSVADITVEEPPMEDVIAAIYARKGEAIGAQIPAGGSNQPDQRADV